MAHRGSSAELPEHTLSAYRRAIEQGADALECDVRLTADGHLVCVHDRRVDRTSNGRGVVSALELAQLEGLDWGSWRERWDDDAQSEVPDRDAGRLLTLRRLLDTVRDCGRDVRVAVETKHPTRHSGLVERTLAGVLADYGWDHERAPVRVMSFSSVALQRMRHLVPGVPLVQLVQVRMPARLREGVLPRGVGTLGVSVRLLHRHPDVVRAVQDRGGRVHVYTVDRTRDVERCVALGVDAIITNRPEHVLTLLGRPPGGGLSTD